MSTKTKVQKSDQEWREQLSDEQYHVTRKHGTERAFTGQFHDHKGDGVYTCVCCGAEMFDSQTKYNSGTGWPSFFQPIAQGNVAERVDRNHGMVRTEINCARCDAHLGHVFPDGPRPTGMRFCLNSESLKFTDEKDLSTLVDAVTTAAAE